MKFGHGAMAKWAPRYFVLDAKKKSLTYYSHSDKAENNKLGSYSLGSDKTTVERNEKSGRPHCILVFGQSENNNNKQTDLWLDAGSPLLLNEWYQALKRAKLGNPVSKPPPPSEVEHAQIAIIHFEEELKELQKDPNNVLEIEATEEALRDMKEHLQRLECCWGICYTCM